MEATTRGTEGWPDEARQAVERAVEARPLPRLGFADELVATARMIAEMRRAGNVERRDVEDALEAMELGD